MGIIKAIVFVSAFIGALFFTGKALYHSYQAITNITGRHSSLLGPFVLLMPNQFNEKGNKHRIALGTSILLLVLFWVVLIVMIELDK